MGRATAFALILLTLIACNGSLTDPVGPAGAQACTAGTLPACEEVLARTIELGDDAGPLARAYAAARRARDADDPFAQAMERALAAAKKGPAALAVVAGAKSPAQAPELTRFETGALEPVGKMSRDALWLALAEGSGLHYLAVARPDGSLLRAPGRDPLVVWMAGLSPVVVDDAAAVIEHDAEIERELRAALDAASKSDYVRASEHVDALDKLADAEPPFDAQGLRARIVLGALNMGAPTPLVSAVDPPPPPPEPEPRAFETGYYDLLRIKLDRTSAGAYGKRAQRMLQAAPADLRGLIVRTWGPPGDSCTVTQPPTFDRPRDLAFAYLLPATLLPAGARNIAGRVALAEWYPRYQKLVDLVDRTKTGFWASVILVNERGGASSIIPSGTDVHRRVNSLALKHARALEELARKRPGRVGISHLGFMASPGAHADESLRRALHDLAGAAAQGSLAESTDPWDILAITVSGMLVSANMPGDMREAHMIALAGAFTAKLRGVLAKQTGWGVSLAVAGDFAYRVLADLGPDAKSTAAEIARALETDPAIGQPGLASLASAFARYAALAAEGTLGSPILEGNAATVPARTAARASMAKALSKLADGEAPDPRVLEELASLADNATATTAYAVAESLRAPKGGAGAASATPADAKAACSDDDTPMDPRLRRALSKLADQRRKLLGMKGLQGKTDSWSRRARLVALVLSDGVDVAAAQGEKSKATAKQAPASGLPSPNPTKFFIGAAEADKIVQEALESFGADGPVVTATVSAYSLTRGFLGEGPEHLSGAGLPKARALVGALSPLVSTPGVEHGASGLLSQLALALGERAPGDAAPRFVGVARSLYDKGSRDEADMVLLAAVIASALAAEPLGPGPFELASEKKSEMAWLFDFLRYARPDTMTRKGTPENKTALGAPRFKPGLDALLTSKCAVASTEAIAGVLDAVERFRRGERDKARVDLEAALEGAGPGLVLPHVVLAFKQETTTRAVNVAIEIDLAAPFVTNTGGFNVGGGFKTVGEPRLDLEVGIDSADVKRVRDGTARYYVHATAVAGVYHFLSGDPQRGERAGARALGAMVQRTWLYAPGVSDEPATFVKDAKATLIVLAQQAIDSGRPLLAGSLLQIVRSSFDPKLTRPEELTGLLDELPRPLRGLTDLNPVVARARKTLALLGGGFTCVAPKHDKAFLMRPTCEVYPQALALRVADSLAGMPAISGGKGDKQAASCADMAALEGFLVPAQGGKYEPEKLTEATQRMLDQKKPFEATFLLTRPRDPAHCTSKLVAQMRDAARQLEGVPTFRADLLTAVVNCEVGAPNDVLIADLTELDSELAKVGDPSRQIQIGLFAAALSVKKADASLLEGVVKKKGFLAGFRQHGPLLPIAMMLDHVASALAGKPVDVEGTKRDMDHLCGLSDSPAGPDICKTLRLLRQDGVSDADRKKTAEEVLTRLSP